MKTFIKAIIVVCLFCLAVSEMKASHKVLQLELTDGTTIEWLLEELPIVEQTTTGITIKSSEGEVSYPLSEVVGFSLEETTSLENVIQEKLSVTIDDDNISIRNLPPGSFAKFYSIDGQLLGCGIADSDGTVSFSKNGRKGLFVIKTRTRAVKVLL